MKPDKLIAIILSICFLTSLAHGQSAFQNLNFEQANPVQDPNSPYYPYAVTAASAFPHWTVSIGGVQQTDVTENDVSTGAAWVSLCGPNAIYGPNPLDGNYSVLLQGGEGNGGPASASISQTGIIPSGTQLLSFIAEGGNDPLDVLIGSQSVSYTTVGEGSGYTVYEANISAWASLPEQLTFSAPSINGEIDNWEIDDISFSAVPEPSPFALTGFGGILFALYRRFMPKRQ